VRTVPGSPPDMIVFEADGARYGPFGWAGPWPPEERLGLAVGERSGIAKVFPVEDEERVRVAAAETGTVRVWICDRASASSLPDDVESEHVARMALYRPA